MFFSSCFSKSSEYPKLSNCYKLVSFSYYGLYKQNGQVIYLSLFADTIILRSFSALEVIENQTSFIDLSQKCKEKGGWEPGSKQCKW